LKRGFKAWAERASLQYRNELGLSIDEMLSIWSLAEHLDVPIWKPTEIPDLEEQAIEQLLKVDPSSWSAVTLTSGDNHLVIYNSSHSEARTHNDLAHELAHIILEHKPTDVQASEAGLLLVSTYEKEHEDEADWLAGSLLVPREGLSRQHRLNSDLSYLAQHFGVSEQLINWRLNHTGILIQHRRARR